MKIQSTKSFFKKVSASAAVRAGEKRPDLEWSFQALEVADLETLKPESVCLVLNNFTEAFGRKLIAQSGDDWNFSLQAESVTFALALEDLVSDVSRSRLVTKESLKALGEFYKVQAQKVLGVASPAALAGEAVIANRFKQIAGKNDALAVMESRLLSLCELVPEEAILPFADLIEALVSELQALQAVKFSADLL